MPTGADARPARELPIEVMVTLLPPVPAHATARSAYPYRAARHTHPNGERQCLGLWHTHPIRGEHANSALTSPPRRLVIEAAIRL